MDLIAQMIAPHLRDIVEIAVFAGLEFALYLALVRYLETPAPKPRRAA